ncbi:Nodule Cysteine-Rich (NCR) secreted peptide [Medicago truncatula]|uniref:Nodule Cysteine-Rich (NCR) secreted peptide n=2 Tax=Medicago truncatula TaxID=3880 RepID=A0A072UKS5_MEDTR|nr:Nodule Cysteine-Rich (NCR) secreted peptide [Medicago truncatula]
MAQILFYVYALIILFSPFLAALVIIDHHKPCVSDTDCAFYLDIPPTVKYCSDGLCAWYFPDNPLP